MKTKIVFIADRSGSMFSMKDDAIGGFNSFIDEQKRVEGQADFTLVLFDDQYEVAYQSKDIEDVENLNEETFVPRGSTALLDAIGKTIALVTEEINATDEEQKPDQVIFCILTDGEENASREYKKDKIKELIEQKQNDEDWVFLFLAANVDAFAEAGSMGLNSNVVLRNGTTIKTCDSYAADGNGIRAAYGMFAQSVSDIRNCKDGMIDKQE